MVVNAYATASFTVTASGPLSLRYQWQFEGANIAGATSSSLTISNVVQTNVGDYSVVVTDDSGGVTSSNAFLSMYPYIPTPFTGTVTYWGQSSTFNVQPWGTGPFTYQWFEDGNAINGATNQTLTLTNIQFTNAGLYSIVVSSALGSATNPPAPVTVEPAGVSLGLCPAVIINGVAGYSYIIESTTNLGNSNSWVTMTNLTLTQPIQLWVDTNTDTVLPGNPQRFYQVLPGQ